MGQINPMGQRNREKGCEWYTGVSARARGQKHYFLICTFFKQSLNHYPPLQVTNDTLKHKTQWDK
jgi:hypothetical protein